MVDIVSRKRKRDPEPITTRFDQLPPEMRLLLLCWCDRKSLCALFTLDEFRDFADDPIFWKRKATYLPLPKVLQIGDTTLSPRERYDQLESLYGEFYPEVAIKYLNPIAYNQRISYHCLNSCGKGQPYIATPAAATPLELASIGYYAPRELHVNYPAWDDGEKVNFIYAFRVARAARNIKDKYYARIPDAIRDIEVHARRFLLKISIYYSSASIFIYLLETWDLTEMEDILGIGAILRLYEKKVAEECCVAFYRRYPIASPNRELVTKYVAQGMNVKEALKQAYHIRETCSVCDRPRTHCVHYFITILCEKPYGNYVSFYQNFPW